MLVAMTSVNLLDAESQVWLDRLAPGSRERDAAVGELHALLLRAARFEVDRRRTSLAASDCEDLAQQSADDALVAVLRRLPDFRGDSRFTTWAYKFALLEAGVKVRRRAWQGREVQLEPEGWALIAQAGSTPHEDVETAELLAALQVAIERELSPRQRQVLLAVTVHDIPIEENDARRKLRTALEMS